MELAASLVNHVEEAGQVRLDLKKGITVLELEFIEASSDGDQRRRMEADEKIIEEMKPSVENLEELSLAYYQGGTLCPSWMTLLINLTTLKLSWLPMCTGLPPLGILPSLDRLEFRHFKSLNKFGSELFGVKDGTAFPKLTYLVLHNFDSLEEWEDEDEEVVSMMPCIQTLHIIQCEKLKKLPDQIVQRTSLQKLAIESCDSLFDRYRDEQGKDRDMIKHIPCFQLLVKYFVQANQPSAY
ncbi:Putative disease resistance protein At1g59780 [Linum perenne]